MVLPAETVARIMALVDDGRSQRYVSRSLGIPETTVRRVVQRYRETGRYTRRPGSGRPRATSSREDRFVVLQTLRNRTQTAVETAARIRRAMDVDISARTVRRRLAEMSLHSRARVTAPQLTPAHRVARLQFAREHENWTEADWAHVMFSDESRFALHSSDGRIRVWRRRGERYAACNTAEMVPFGGGSVMVWGGITLDARTELHVFQRPSMNARVYITEVLEQYVMPFAPFIGEEFLLMHDNARPHVANEVQVYLNEIGVRTLRWPARSPDLNPIEHIWDELGVNIRRRLNPPLCLQELRAVLTEEWERIPQEHVANLIRSMTRRLQAVIQARGGNTRY